MFFITRVTKPTIDTGREFEPEGFIETCTKDAVNGVLDKMIPQGGKVVPLDYATYNDIKVTYLCKNINYYEPCVNQYPSFLKFLKQELKDNIQGKVIACFNTLEAELRNRNYEVTRGNVFVALELKPEIIEVKTTTQLTLKKNNVVQRFTSFSTIVRSPLYDLGHVAQEIVSQEARFCYFSNDGFSILYPEFDVKRNTLSEGTKIYSIEHTETEEVMNIAIRGCAIPQGF